MSKKILVFDDDAFILGYVGKILTEAGYTVVKAKDLIEAMTFVRTVDAQIVDIRLTVSLSGWDYLRLLEECGINLPSLMITAYEHEEGPASVLMKPFSKDDLLEALKDIFTR